MCAVSTVVGHNIEGLLSALLSLELLFNTVLFGCMLLSK